MLDGEFLACDWGTTHLRAYVIREDGHVVRRQVFPWGVGQLSPGDAPRIFRGAVRRDMNARDLPAILCGMVGSNLGWTVVPYKECPADLVTLARHLYAAETHPPVWIVPGLQCPGITHAPDVMRGEETQIFGWTSCEPQRQRGRLVVCHPGTHTKWVLIEDDHILKFVTAMTGELFGVLRTHGVLKTQEFATDTAAFDEGVAAAGDGNALAARLFSTRSRVVTGTASIDSSSAYLSGLLIGAETVSVRGFLGTALSQGVHLMGDPVLCAWYERALSRLGGPVTVHDGEAAAIAGFCKLRAATS